ncbi:MAG: aminopeptidase P family protein [Chloroflexi bacterium]|nr:aminopeptidase P family protein [Chloroflexota bacterium]
MMGNLWHARLERLQQALAQRGYDAFVASQRPNQLYFLPHPDPAAALPPVPYIIFAEGEPVVFPGLWFYFACRDQLTSCQVVRQEIGGPDTPTQLAKYLGKRGFKRLAFDHLPPTLAATLQAHAPHTICATEWLAEPLLGAELRRTKEPEELELMRAVAHISDLGIQAAFRAARPGVTNRDLAAEATYVMLKAGCEQVSMQVNSGPGAGYLGTGTWTFDPRRTVQAGDMLVIDMGIAFHGYVGDQTRTAIIGEGTPIQREILETIQRAYFATRAAMVPGASSGEIYQITVDLLAEKGWREFFPHHIGHGLGLGGDLPNITLESQDILQMGDTLSCEPGVYVPGVGGARIENMIYVAAEGATELTQSPAEPVLGI